MRCQLSASRAFLAASSFIHGGLPSPPAGASLAIVFPPMGTTSTVRAPPPPNPPSSGALFALEIFRRSSPRSSPPIAGPTPCIARGLCGTLVAASSAHSPRSPGSGDDAGEF